MNKELDLAVRDYLRSGGATKLFGDVFGLFAFIVVGQLLKERIDSFPKLAVFSLVLTDPFAVLATAVFLFSQTLFDFMKFRLQISGTSSLPSDPLIQQLEIPNRNRNSFGNDWLANAWRWRLMSIAFFGIAVIRRVLA